MSILKKKFTYVDLFAGIGGFHLAMEKFAKETHRTCVCVWSSEINENCKKVYENNFDSTPLGDIRKIDVKEQKLINPDVICGGFPCQTFSKSGKQEGFKDSRGTLFREIIKIIEECDKKPKFLLLENVQNLISHDHGNTWKVIYNELADAGYNIIKKPIVVAPKDFGIPQLRNRAIILGVRKDLFSKEILLDIERKKVGLSKLEDILDKDCNNSKYLLNKHQLDVLNFYNELIGSLNEEDRIIGFPIWIDCFKKRIDPNYPERKKNIILKNKKFYKKYKNKIDELAKKYDIYKKFVPVERKFEWQAGKSINSVYKGIIQFRTSGVRVKRPTESPALVAMDHRPIYGPLKRYISVKEGARLQSFPDDFKFLDNEKESFKQLGNAVNVDVVFNVFNKFINSLDKEIKNG